MDGVGHSVERYANKAKIHLLAIYYILHFGDKGRKCLPF